MFYFSKAINALPSKIIYNHKMFLVIFLTYSYILCQYICLDRTLLIIIYVKQEYNSFNIRMKIIHRLILFYNCFFTLHFKVSIDSYFSLRIKNSIIKIKISRWRTVRFLQLPASTPKNSKIRMTCLRITFKLWHRVNFYSGSHSIT